MTVFHRLTLDPVLNLASTLTRKTTYFHEDKKLPISMRIKNVSTDFYNINIKIWSSKQHDPFSQSARISSGQTFWSSSTKFKQNYPFRVIKTEENIQEYLLDFTLWPSFWTNTIKFQIHFQDFKRTKCYKELARNLCHLGFPEKSIVSYIIFERMTF